MIVDQPCLKSDFVGDGLAIRHLKNDRNESLVIRGEINDFKTSKNISDPKFKLDVISQWTHLYPRTYLGSHPYLKNLDYKPVVVDWTKERIFMVPVSEIVDTGDPRYFMIPRYADELMNEFVEQNFKKRFCENCNEENMV